MNAQHSNSTETDRNLPLHLRLKSVFCDESLTERVNGNNNESVERYAGACNLDKPTCHREDIPICCRQVNQTEICLFVHPGHIESEGCHISLRMFTFQIAL